MAKVIVFSLVCILSCFTAIACERSRGVFAGGDEAEQYQPRRAPQKASSSDTAKNEIKGELMRVDLSGKTISVRVETGMEQTFNFDDYTAVTGLENRSAKMRVRDLLGKEGSDVTVQWRDAIEADEAKIATNIEVTQLSTAKSPRRGSRKR